jgi:biopolymer transport protein ExbB/TolQ
VLGTDAARRKQLPASLARLLADVERSRDEGRLDDGGLEHLVLASEEGVRRQLSGSRLLVKVGPSLGLLGTLIPMGTALASLATGNLEAMAGQMVVAFTTTIVGLACGTAAYVILSVRQHWVTETVREQRFLAERIAAELARGS